MQTTAQYLEDPYIKNIEATIVEILPEKEGVLKIVLNTTIFYPMGGGQPTDQGTLTFPDGTTGEVYQVLFKDGVIFHYVKTKTAPNVGQNVQGAIDWDRRYRNMRVHSAAHVIDFALFLLGYSPSPLHPLKGDHGKKPFIIYSGTLPKDIRVELQQKTDELIAKNMRFSWCFEPLEVLQKEAIYLQPGLPQNKPLRTLRLEGVGAVADGGTIVASTGEVGRVTVLPLETVEGTTRIPYAVAN